MLWGKDQLIQAGREDDVEGNISLSPSMWSSLLMAIGGMGDALLYAYLPVKGEALGLSLFSIGLLLSINKFSRFFTNRWIAWLCSRWGVKNVLLLGVVFSTISTFIYALGHAVWIWIAGRLMWGAAYSAMRFATIQYAGKNKNKGSALGIARSIQDAGPMLAYWIGPVMLTSLGAGFTFATWGALLVLLFPVFYLIPVVQHQKQKIKPFSFQKPAWIDVWVFGTSFVVEGFLIVGMSHILNIDNRDADRLLLVSSIYISLRRLLNVIISPVSGWLSDRFGFLTIFQASCLMIASGTALIGLGSSGGGIFLCFVGSAINLTLVPIVAIDFGPEYKSFDALTRINTSRDMGSATGSLTGLGLLSIAAPSGIFISLFLILISIWFKIRKFNYRHE
ncbi:Putative MFS transporter [Fulvivirga imtechensis AK7]|uniref:Putative MFS transporter n=1 Tax=Fulvivirga imtechensis AK7 TaxID=1237149 RepID=L8JN10_9BACT|nr:MFS transporter [Fulvivirga imtechensis]ELR70220.1 Putative MFS transporter [Fulvivirga imtechensis AK7]